MNSDRTAQSLHPVTAPSNSSRKSQSDQHVERDVFRLGIAVKARDGDSSAGVAGFDDGASDGSTIWYSRPIFKRSSVLTAPEGQRTVSRVTSSAVPTPIRSRGSFDDSRLHPPLRWRWMVRPPATTSTRAPMASRLLRVPSRSRRIQWFWCWCRCGACGGAVLVVDDDVDVAVVVEVAEGGPSADVVGVEVGPGVAGGQPELACPARLRWSRAGSA